MSHTVPPPEEVTLALAALAEISSVVLDDDARQAVHDAIDTAAEADIRGAIRELAPVSYLLEPVSQRDPILVRLLGAGWERVWTIVLVALSDRADPMGASYWPVVVRWAAMPEAERDANALAQVTEDGQS